MTLFVEQPLAKPVGPLNIQGTVQYDRGRQVRREKKHIRDGCILGMEWDGWMERDEFASGKFLQLIPISKNV